MKSVSNLEIIKLASVIFQVKLGVYYAANYTQFLIFIHTFGDYLCNDGGAYYSFFDIFVSSEIIFVVQD